MKVAFVLGLVTLFASCGQSNAPETSGTASADEGETAEAPAQPSQPPAGGTRAAPPLEDGQAEAILAGGCFWCMERPFEALDGVVSVESGYTGGNLDHVTYRQIGTGRTGHYEAVRIVYDPSRVTYERLLEVFWRNIDPTQANGQFCDRGPQYRSAIFVKNDDERRLATASRQSTAEHLDARVVTEILAASSFWLAEDYHQDYYRTHPIRYATYRAGCGRDRRLQQLWGESAGH